jgi:alpha-L-fucosidase 2
MTRRLTFVLILLIAIAAFAEDLPFVAANDVVWNSPGKNENDSMPIGNGDLAANVWTEQNGDIVLLVSKADAWTELNKPVKLGRVRLRLIPNPFAAGADFIQTLRLEDATVVVRSGSNEMKVWVDANHPVLHVEGSLAQPLELQAVVEVWRTKDHPYDQA